jgi:hypothetical protein
MMFIATPDQITTHQRQQSMMKIQAQNLLVRLERRMQVAIESRDRYLITQLQSERELLSKQL